MSTEIFRNAEVEAGPALIDHIFWMRYLNEATARAWCVWPRRIRFAKRPRGLAAPKCECTVLLEFAQSVVSMAPQRPSLSFHRYVEPKLPHVSALFQRFPKLNAG